MLSIQRMLQPERQDAVKQFLAIDFPQFEQARANHPLIPETIMPSMK